MPDAIDTSETLQRLQALERRVEAMYRPQFQALEPVQRTAPAAAETPTSPAARSGVKSSELWLSAAAIVTSSLLAEGTLPEGSVLHRVVTIAGIFLTAIGYTVSRAVVKKAVAK